MTINGELGSLSIFGLITFVALANAVLIPWLVIKDRLIQLEVNNSGLLIYSDGKIEKVDWHQVERISQIVLVHPPLYKLKLREQDDYYIFIPRPFFISIGFWVWDISPMGKFIKQKKAQGHF